jgi:agmatinase
MAVEAGFQDGALTSVCAETEGGGGAHGDEEEPAGGGGVAQLAGSCDCHKQGRCGGWQGITPALVRGVRRVHAEPRTVVQIDAHADLRDECRGTAFSHACAMRRLLDENPGLAVQIGIRSYSAEEAAYIKANRGSIAVWPSRLLRDEDPADVEHRIRASLRDRPVYLTIDVDGLDPSIVPATGTPEPDRLGWAQVCGLLRLVAEAGRVVTLDCVELAPPARAAHGGVHRGQTAL